MYCSACGQSNVPDATTCSKCGRPIHAVAPGVPPVVPSTSGRVERHIQTLGILWLVYALMGVVGWFIAIPFITGFFGMAHHGFPMGHGWPFGAMGVPWFIPFVTVFVLLRSGLQLLTGVALLMRVHWGRILAIVIAILSLIKIPFGTALGIYTLWVLLPGDAAYAYERLATR